MKQKSLLPWLAIFAVMTLFNTGRWAVAAAVWLVPIFGLYIIHQTSVRRGFLLLWAAIYIPTCIGWLGAIPFPAAIYPLFMLFNAFVATLPYVADRLITPRLGTHFATSLVFPLAATAVEFIMMADGPLGSFGAQSYTQYGFAPMAQLASVSGLWGITFLVSWFGAVVHWASRRYDAGASYWRGAVVYAAILVALVAFGWGRLLNAPEVQGGVPVASFTAVHVNMAELMQLRSQDEAAFRERTRAQHEAYLTQTVTAAQTGAQIVLWPELAGLGLAEDVEALVSRGQALAAEYDIYLAMPLFVLDPGGETTVNKMVVADPQGEIVLDHVKYGGNILEGTLAGNRVLQIIETPFGKMTAVICWDTDYPGVIRQAGVQDVDILLSPAYVWPEVAAIHAKMATFRAIENGMTVVRQSDNGFSLISDPYGRIVTQENHIGREGAMMVGAAPVMPTETLYPMLGDLVGLLSLGGFGLLSATVFIRQWLRGRTEQERTPAQTT